MKIEFFKHNIDKKDIAAVNDVLRSIFLTTGPRVRSFEAKFADFLGIDEVVGLTSCTGAIHLSLLRHGVGPGDEVITTPLTFAATATAILETGAKPVFVDVCPKSGLLLAGNVKKAITKRTKAIIPVHLYGRMVDMRAFSLLARKHGLALIEDSAHCIEGERDGVRPGQLSDAACFSFYATKGMTSGEGGAIACKSAEDADWYRSARHHGISKNAAYRYTKKYEHWDMKFFGWKYNMDDIQAALLINQIDRLDKYRKKRQDLEWLYRRLLARIPGLELLELPEPGELSGHHLFTVLLPRDLNRDEILARLDNAKIGCAVNYRAIHTLEYFRKKLGYHPSDFPFANDIGDRTISLPLYPKLSIQQVKYVCAALRKIIDTLRR